MDNLKPKQARVYFLFLIRAFKYFFNLIPQTTIQYNPMSKPAQTEASNMFQDILVRESFQEMQDKKTKNPFLTPQRRDETLRKQILDIRLSKTDDNKKSIPLDLRFTSSFPFKTALFSSSTQKEIKYTGCNCRKSQCLKMYCTCFAVGKMCDQTCLCDSCKNDYDNMDRSQAINEIIEKDPFAFSKKTDAPNINFEDDFCNCRKSNCTKKYCDCYRRGKACGSKCNCTDCNNCTSQSDLEKNSDSEPKKRTKME